MLHLDEYDLVILGSGQSGKYLARTLASQGKHVAVIEQSTSGGLAMPSPVSRARM